MDSVALAQEAIYTHGAVQKLEELHPLIRVLQSRNLGRVLEIGTQEGGTLWTWMQLAVDDATIVSLDIDQSKNEQWRGREQQKVYFMEGDSHDLSVRARVSDRLDGPVDLLFIDGDHTYEGVKADYYSYTPLVQPGGLIVLHDIAPSFHPDSHVDRLWVELGIINTLEYIDPNPATIRRGVVLPADSCGIGILFC